MRLGLAPERLRSAARQHAAQSATVDTIRGTRSSWSAKMVSGLEGAFVGLRPQMGAGFASTSCRHPQLRAGLTQAAFHHVAGAELLPVARTSPPRPA